MLILPVGHAESTVRRHPLVSYTLIGLNVAVFVVCLALRPGPDWSDEVRGKFRSMVRQVGENPWLELPPLLAQQCGRECREALDTARRQFQAPLPWVLEEQQRALDESATELVELLRRDPTYRHGFVPARPDAAQLMASLFLHAGWLHIVGNLLFLFLSGPFVEDVYGRPLFTALYLGSGVAAALAHAAKAPDSTVPLVGASGAIAGVMGAFLIRLGTRRIRLMVLPVIVLPFIRFTFSVPAFVVLPVWLGEQIWYARISEGPGGVAWWAHVGGFACGAVAAVVVKLTRVEERFIHPHIERQVSFEMNPHLQAAMDLRFRGMIEAAQQEVRQAVLESPGDADAWREAYEVAVARGDHREVGRCALRALDLYARAGDHEQIASLAQDTLDRAGPGLPPRFYSAAATQLERALHRHLAVQLYQCLVERHPQDPAAFRALVRRGEIFRRSGDVQAAADAYRRALDHPACTDDLRRAVEQSLTDLRRS